MSKPKSKRKTKRICIELEPELYQALTEISKTYTERYGELVQPVEIIKMAIRSMKIGMDITAHIKEIGELLLKLSKKE